MSDFSTPEQALQGVDALVSGLYEDLRRLARRERRRGGSPQTLDTTALVSELYLRLADTERLRFGDARQFFAYAARAMRHIVLDRARNHARLKAGGDQVRVSFTAQGMGGLVLDPTQALELDDSLRALAAEDARAAEVVELHFFAGLPLERVAEVLGLTRRTIDRDWQFARSYLLARLRA